MDAVVYGLFFNDGPEPVCVYVGTTKRDPEIRLAEHKRNARKGKIDKPLYFFLRKRDLIEEIYIEVLQSSSDGMTDYWEDEWVKTFRDLGHPLTNAKEGNTKIVRPKDSFNEMWKAVNTAACLQFGLDKKEPAHIESSAHFI